MSTNPDDWHPGRDRAFRYQHQRATRLPHWIRLEKGFTRHIHWEERKDCIVLFIDTPMEDQYSDSYLLHPKVRQWMNDVVINHEDWDFEDHLATIKFRHKHHAMMFKLAFSDGVVR